MANAIFFLFWISPFLFLPQHRLPLSSDLSFLDATKRKVLFPFLGLSPSFWVFLFQLIVETVMRNSGSEPEPSLPPFFFFPSSPPHGVWPSQDREKKEETVGNTGAAMPRFSPPLFFFLFSPPPPPPPPLTLEVR